PRLHDVRPGGGRGGIQRARRPLYRGRGQLYRHGRRLHERGLRGDHRQGPQGGCARRRRARHEGPLPDGQRPERRRPLPQARDRGLRGQPPSPRHGLHRPLSGPLLGRGDAASRDSGCPLRPRACRQGPLHRGLELHGVADREERVSERRSGPGALRVPAAAILPGRAQRRVRDPAGLSRGGPWRDPLEPPWRRLSLGQVPPRRAAARRLAHRGGGGADGGVLGPARHRAQLGRARRGWRDKRGHRPVLRPDLAELAPPPAGRYGPYSRGAHPRTTRGQPRRHRLGPRRGPGGPALRGGGPRRHLPPPLYPQRPAGL
ncbi:MAG: hypothetical protein AVDCRST_MAG01-01-2393, partial [uncultured Rubrobacteraceae bacterium]